jgi:serine/threonine protein kinase
MRPAAAVPAQAVSEELKDLLNRMLHIDPTLRARMVDVVNHPWLSDDHPEIPFSEFLADMESRKK